MAKLEITDEGDGRVSVPLMMIAGNLQILLENTIPCEGISLVQHKLTGSGVVLMISGLDREVAKQLGFKTVAQ